MTPKAFLAFTAVTAVVVVTASFVVVERYATATFVKEKEPIFPSMHDKVNDVTELLYEDKQVRIKVARQPDGQFVLAERHNSPVSSQIVRELVIGLAELKVLEPKRGRRLGGWGFPGGWFRVHGGFMKILSRESRGHCEPGGSHESVARGGPTCR